MSEQQTPQTPELDENRLIAERRQKLGNLRSQGPAFPNDFRRTHLAQELHAEFDGVANDELEQRGVRVQVAGRMMAKRIMGKASFTHIKDMSGTLQLFLQKDALAASYDSFKTWDIGDILGAEGTLFRTKTGELSVKVESLRLLTKSLRPLPDKFHGLTDTEQRYRQRYVDLMMNDSTRQAFRMRSQVIRGIREFFDNRGFIEVETPMMHPIPGGASARPFVTHHNALDMEFYLRIAPELYLKRLVVGGFEQVYEINRNFRNEGVSTRHNPEFTMLEFYWAYADYRDLMDLTEELLRGLALRVVGQLQFPYQGETIDFAAPFARFTVPESIVRYIEGTTLEQVNDLAQLQALAERLGVEFAARDSLGQLQMAIFDECVEAQLRQPTFITAYPIEVSPLARRNDSNPAVTDRFEFFIGGRELANGFSELNDPEDQHERFMDQVRAKEAGDEEAMYYDADYVRALEYGLPPTAGEGIGIDRLVMLFTDSPSIRDVLLFPHMRPEAL